MLKNKIVLISGGSGSLGKGLLKVIEAKEIRVMSRSELGQDELRAKYPNVKFILGDVANYDSVADAMRGVDIVIHAAAFKYLNLAEEQPLECVLSNVIGSMNIIKAAKEEKVEKCIGISTDKVAYARNVYGCSKHIMEKLFKEADRNSDTKFCCVRYGNVLGTNGSVLTIWKRQLEAGEPLTVTDKRMTRFFFKLEEAIELIFYALKNTKGGEVFVRKSTPRKIYEMAEELSKDIKITGLRPGEKLFEVLIADYEGEEYTSNMEEDKDNKIIIL